MLFFSSIEIVKLPNANSISVVFSTRLLILAAANINNLVEKTTDIEFALGNLTISIDEKNSIHMKGPVSDIKNIDIKL